MRARSLAAALLLAASTASAAPELERRIDLYEREARALATDMPRPNQSAAQTGQRRLVDAQVAFAIGDYDAASLILFDLVNKQGPDREAATYYLAESLYQKGDRSAARGYFQTFIKATTSGNKHYQPALQRLVEIGIMDGDNAIADEAIGVLVGISPALRLPSVPYVQGKYAFAQGKYDDALGLFASVPKGTEAELQALYYTGTAHIAKDDYAKATETFTDLIGRKPKTNTDRRVIELAQLALGRLYYEREQSTKSIDAYLLVDRGSDLFPTALYEVSWVYVKSKQYDKALVALELLNRLDSRSTQSATVRILEGNLRVRKAQMLRQAEITGTLNQGETSDPPKEYDKADKIFADTHAQYEPSYLALKAMVDGKLDPASFIDQISGRNTRVFAAAAPIPETAAQWLREEPAVQRIVRVEADLADVRRNIKESLQTIARLEGVLATGDRLTLYPKLSSRRMRIATMQHDLVRIRSELADQQIAQGATAGGTSNRKAVVAQYTTLGDPERAYGERTGAQQQEFEKAEAAALEVERIINSTQAMAVALRKYALEAELPADQRDRLQGGFEDATREARAIEDELAEIHQEILLGRDLAGIGDPQLKEARELRAQVKAAQDAEHRELAGTNRPATALADRAARLADTLAQTDEAIDRLVAQGIEELKSQLAAERKELEEFQRLEKEHAQEARTLGAQVLSNSFNTVMAKLYDVVIRTDVGSIDVAWSRKEDSDDDLKRLNLARSRDLKQLRDEFRFILDQTSPTPAAPKKAELPAAKEGERVKPAGEQEPKTTQPVVRPDNDKSNQLPPPPQPKRGTP